MAELSNVVRVALYMRISKDKKKTAVSIETQRPGCVRLIESRLGWVLAYVFMDNDISASRKNGVVAERPEFKRMCALIAAGEIDAVVAWNGDRLFRDPLEQEQFILMCEVSGMYRIATIEDNIDLVDGNGLMVFRIKGAVAAEEARKARLRIIERLEANATRGVPHGGPTPFGYRRVTGSFEPIEERAVEVRRSAKDVLSGTSLGEIARRWNAMGFTSHYGGPWERTTVKRLLVNPALAGLRSYRKQIVGPGTWPPILDMATHEALVALDKLRHNAGISAPRRHAFTGLTRCGRCGFKLVPHGSSGKADYYRRYICTGPNCSLSVAVNHVDEACSEAIVGLATSERVQIALGENNHEDLPVELPGELHELETRLSALEDDYRLNGDISREDYTRIKSVLSQRRDGCKARLEAFTMTTMNPEPASFEMTPTQFQREFEAMPLHKQAALAEFYLESVVVEPAACVGRGSNAASRVRITLPATLASVGSEILSTPSASAA